MLSAVLATIADHELLRAGDRVIVAVSGGPDSMALLHALWELRGRLGLTLEVAAVDHGLRADAAREVELVRERAEALGLPFSAVAVDVAAERRRRRGRVPAGRGARRAACGRSTSWPGRTGPTGWRWGIRRTTRPRPCSIGSSAAPASRGLAGIPYRRDVFVRPLLDVTRAQILRYLRRRSIPFVEDPSNADPRFARARIRHRILPALAQENPRVAEALRALAAAARDGGGAPADAARWRSRGAPPRRSRGSPRVAAPPASTSRAAVAWRSRIGRIRVHERANGSAVRQAAPKPAPIVIDRPGTYRWPDAGAVEVRALAVRSSKKKSSSRDEFDADRWPGRWSCGRGGPGTGCGRAAAVAAASFRTS